MDPLYFITGEDSSAAWVPVSAMVPILCIAALFETACSQRVAPASATPAAGQGSVVRAIRHQNLQGITEQEITSYFQERGVLLAVERRVEPKDVEEVRSALKEFLALRKQPVADIETEVVPMPPRVIEVRFTIKR